MDGGVACSVQHNLSTSQLTNLGREPRGTDAPGRPQAEHESHASWTEV